MNELVLDFFAGGGGASEGIEQALGRPVDYAINHDPKAIAMHRINHPGTRHMLEDVFKVNPHTMCRGRSVGLAWFSPDCTFHSKARGSKPFRDRDPARRRRGLAGIVPRWMAAVRPRVVCLENVEEFTHWGPLDAKGKPDPARRGQSFRRWHSQIENLGYRVDMREMAACDYGAPTTRNRLFVIARCDGEEIVFPEATHGPLSYQQPYRTAAECIDWSIPCQSIFEPGRDLVENTLKRIARGIQRYVLDDPQPFIVNLRGTSDAHIAGSASSVYTPLHTISAGGTHHALVTPFIANTRNGEREGQLPRVRDIREPYPTVTAHGSQGALVCAFLAKHYGGHEGSGTSLRAPMDAVTSRDHHSLVYGFLMKYYGTEQDPGLRRPLDTITTKDRFGLVTVRVAGEPYVIADIGMRMLTPRELFRAQGIGDHYTITHGLTESGEVLPLTKEDQVRMCGNSVSPYMSRVLVRENFTEQCMEIAA